MKAIIIVTSSSDDKLKQAEQIGADCRINYNSDDAASAVRGIAEKLF